MKRTASPKRRMQKKHKKELLRRQEICLVRKKRDALSPSGFRRLILPPEKIVIEEYSQTIGFTTENLILKVTLCRFLSEGKEQCFLFFARKNGGRRYSFFPRFSRP